MIRGDDPRRFQSYVAVDANGCWIWTGGKTVGGYGQFRLMNAEGVRENWYTHRWAYTQNVGPIPDGMQLDHLCRVRACCNPSHLEPVTQTVNILRGERPLCEEGSTESLQVGARTDRRQRPGQEERVPSVSRVRPHPREGPMG